MLHSTLLGSATAVVSPTLLIGLGLLSTTAAGPRAIPIGLLVAGVVIGAASLLTFPRRCVVTPTGVTRICWARRHHLSWQDIAVVARVPRRRRARDGQRAEATSEPERTVSGGLLALGHGRRSWMLTDQVESRAEYDAVATVLAEVPATRLRAERPHPAATPTDLYRRGRRAHDRTGGD
ncbi:MAG: hypothetical protein ACLFRD_05300 [Nitriliruptoraceae bacterium]